MTLLSSICELDQKKYRLGQEDLAFTCIDAHRAVQLTETFPSHQTSELVQPSLQQQGTHSTQLLCKSLGRACHQHLGCWHSITCWSIAPRLVKLSSCLHSHVSHSSLHSVSRLLIKARLPCYCAIAQCWIVMQREYFCTPNPLCYLHASSFCISVHPDEIAVQRS